MSPSATTKKIYYNLFQNLHTFILTESIGKEYIQLLNDYPVSQYLHSRTALVQWVHKIHNVINVKLQKKEMSLEQFYYDFYQKYKNKKKDKKNKENGRYAVVQQRLTYAILLCFITGLVVYLYNKQL
jgi:hypothetical protein